MNESFFVPAFCTLEQAAKLKGGSSAKCLRSRKWHQPECGLHFQKLNGNRVWTREQVLRWLLVTDDSLEEYAAEIGADISRFFKDGRNLR